MPSKPVNWDKFRRSRFHGNHSFNTDVLQSVVDEARTWINTPYLHLGREKGVGADCICIPVEVSKHLDLHHHDVKWYSDTPHGGLVEKEADKHWTILADAPTKFTHQDLIPGTVIAFFYSVRSEMQHFGVVTEHPAIAGVPCIVHAMRHAKKVQEAQISDFWWKRRMKVYALPGTLSET